MPLPPGTRLGPYEIVAALGAGGMGEVYRARDGRLGREVAIKVLAAPLASDPEMLARFAREARAIAALAHPNLLAIYDVGSERGLDYAVTELLEGGTLRERLATGALSESEAVEIARQLLAGLAAAHGRGYVHRDLKPENVFLTRAGHVKILDFGLVKRTPGVPGPEVTAAPTITSDTTPGTVMGTMGYMPPEQLRGQLVDARADVFAFGAVLYELLAGRRAFAGESGADTVAAVLTKSPPALATAGRAVSPALEALIERCLEKDAAARFASAGEALAALDAATSAGAGPPRAGGGRRLPARRAALALILGAALVAASLLAWRLAHRAAPGVPIRTRAVAMLAFENLTGDASLDWIGRGLPELLGTALARSPELDVYDPQRLANLLAGAGHARDSSASIDERLRARGVGRAIVGSILRSGSAIRLQCRVVDVESGRVLHADATEGAAGDDLFRLAAGLIPKLQTWLEIDLAGSSAGDRWLREITTSSSDAYKLYLRGHEAMMASRWRESADYDQQSLALDSTFVAARVDLTGCLWNLGDEARTQESLAAARRLRGRATDREALQLDMIDAVVAGDAGRLVRTASALRALYPENRFFTYLLGRGYYTGGDFARCIEVLAPLVAERWTWGWTYVLTARAQEQLGRVDEARRTLALGMEVTGRNPELAFVDAQFLERHAEPGAARDVLLAASRSPALAETPEFEAQIRNELGRMDESRGERDSARAEFARALAVSPPGAQEAKTAAAALRRLGARP